MTQSTRTQLARTRQAAAAGLLALARKEVNAKDVQNLAKQANAAARQAHKKAIAK